MQITEYDENTGAIMGVWTFGDDSSLQDVQFKYIEGAHNGVVEYVQIQAGGAVAAPRPLQKTRQDKTHIKADGKDKVTFSGLPKPCKIWVNFEACECNDGVLELTSLLAGVHQIHVEAFPFQTWHGEVIADGV